VQWVREYLRLSQVQLCQRLEELGFPMHQSVLARLENGDRPIRVDELFAIAAALGVAPVYLLSGDLTNERIDVTPTIQRGPTDVRLWIQGTGALDEQSQETFFELVPDEERLARQWRGLKNLQLILRRRLEPALARRDDLTVRDAIHDMRTELKWLQDEIAHEEARAQRAGEEK
jgi:transcriptional regulator with XRE-family HTH domain